MPHQAIARYVRHIREKISGRVPASAPVRSPRWRAVERAFLASNPACFCGSKKNLNVHHVKPYHLYPELELDPGNLTTLCRAHHQFIGHLGNWKCFNISVIEDAKAWQVKIASRISWKV